jgi:hypothetical protein
MGNRQYEDSFALDLKEYGVWKMAQNYAMSPILVQFPLRRRFGKRIYYLKSL